MADAKQTQSLNIPLSPDFDSIYSELQARVLENPDSIWHDVLTAGTGSYLMRSLASLGADTQYATERAQHEVMLNTARRPTSIYSICRMLGVHIQRKIPATVLVNIARDVSANTSAINTALVIPAYSRWTVSGKSYFNRSDIMFGPGITELSVNLFRGDLATETLVSNGSANQRFKLSVPAFRISDLDIFANIGTPVRKWTNTRIGLWEHGPSDYVFHESTAVDGNVILEFGDGTYGAIPTAGSFEVSYIVVQQGAYDEALDLNPVEVNALVDCLDSSVVAGVAVGETSAIFPEREASFYKRHAPHIRSARRFGNTRNHIRALALEYPGVIDARFLYQAETNPNDLRYMTSIGSCLLTSSKWGDADWNLFVNYMHGLTDSARHFYRIPVENTVIDFKYRVLLDKRASRDFVKDKMRTLITEFMTPKEGSLGASYSLTAINQKIMDGTVDPYGNLITFLSPITPVSDLIATPSKYFTLGSIDLEDINYDPSMVPIVSQGTSVPGGLIGVRG